MEGKTYICKGFIRPGTNAKTQMSSSNVNTLPAGWRADWDFGRGQYFYTHTVSGTQTREWPTDTITQSSGNTPPGLSQGNSAQSSARDSPTIQGTVGTVNIAAWDQPPQPAAATQMVQAAALSAPTFKSTVQHMQLQKVLLEAEKSKDGRITDGVIGSIIIHLAIGSADQDELWRKYPFIPWETLGRSEFSFSDNRPIHLADQLFKHYKYNQLMVMSDTELDTLAIPRR
jgi:hypothetical protein